MLLDRTHRQWSLISTAIFAVATVIYVIYANSSPKGATGGSLIGLTYGIIGTAMMIFAGLLAGRKQVPHWRIGSAQFWLRGHLWLGALSFPFIIYHSGFGLGGLLEQLLWVFFTFVIASGFFGLLMQHFLPRLITTQIPRETFVAQIPYVRKRARLLCDKLVSMDCGRIKITEDELKPQLEALAKHAVEVAEKAAKAKGKEEKDRVKELKENWAERLQPEYRTLFIDMAMFAKAERWITREDDFTSHLHEVYDFSGIALPSPAKKEKADVAGPAGLEGLLGDKPDKAQKSLEASRARRMEGVSASTHSGDKKISALEMMKLRAAAKKVLEGSSKDGPAEAIMDMEIAEQTKLALAASRAKRAEGASGHSIDKSISALDMMKLRAAAKKMLESPSTEEPTPPTEVVEAPEAPKPTKKLSPLEQARQQAGKKAEAATPDGAASATTGESPASAEPAKKLSPLEIARQQAAKKAALSGTTEAAKPIVTQVADAPASAAEPEKKLSPLELMKQQAAAKKAAAAAAEQPAASVEAPAASEPEKKLSPLELMKQQAAAKKAAAAAEQPAPVETSSVAPSEPEKKLSPLELMKQQAAAKKAAASAEQPAAPAEASNAAPSEPEKKLSPLELMKQQAAAKKAATGGTTAEPATASSAAPEAGTEKPKSPLELMKAKAAAGKPTASTEVAAEKPAAAPKPPVPKPTGPAPEIVKRVTAPVQVLRTNELHHFYLTLVRPYLNGNGREGRLSDTINANREFTQMREILPIELHDVVQALQDRVDEHRQYAELKRIHRWLHYWLALHIPTSIALFVLVFAHVICALRVIPWSF